MKTTRKFFAAAFMALGMTAFTACVEEATPVLPEEDVNENLVEMTIEASQVDVRSTFSGKQIGWEVGDKVAVYDGTAKREFSVASVNDGTAVITGLVAEGAADFYAVFPYSAARDLLPDTGGNISIALPQEQILAPEKNFDEDAFVTAGKVIDKKVVFRNIVSLLKLNIPEGVTSVAVKGLDTDVIAGAAKVTYAENAAPSVAAGKLVSGSVVLKPSGETFDAGEHYIALLPTTLSKGFRVVYQSNDNEMAIKRSAIPEGGVVFPLNGGLDITAATSAEKLTWIPNPLMDEDDLLYFVGNQSAYSGEEAKLGQDIVLSKEWTPVDLTGTLDGQGYTISGLNVNATGNTLGAMMSIAAGAELRNVTVEGNIKCATTANNVPAGLVGHLHGTMRNVVNKTNIEASSTNQQLYVGGCAGWVHGAGKMIDCENAGTVTLGSTSKLGYAGGVCGVIYSDSGSGLVQDCVNTGTVKSTAVTTNGLGGVVGVQESGETVGCVNKGTVIAQTVKASSGGVGGVVGMVYNVGGSVSRVYQCENEGSIEITGVPLGTGGIVGVLAGGTAAAEILQCRNDKEIVAPLTRTRGASGMDGTYLGGIVGAINVSDNASAIVNTIGNCINNGNISAVSASSVGSKNSIKVGGICGNTRGLVTLSGNENTASVKLENPAVDGSFCSVGGIVGEAGDPWNNEIVNLTVSENINRGDILSKTNATYSAAGGLIGCGFTPMTLTANRNYGNVERAAADGTTPATEACFCGGLVGLLWLTGEGPKENFVASFDGDMTIGNVTSYGRAGIIFGGMYSRSYGQFNIKDCVVGGTLTSKHSAYENIPITAENMGVNNGLTDGGYMWSYLASGRYGLTISTKAYGEESSYTDSNTLAAWQPGYMDIHHISTGRGNCTFMILPDGTTMMVDAGDNGPDNSNNTKLARVPNESLTPGEWIVRYASHFLAQAGLPKKIDYMLVTHFHNDHLGVAAADYPMSSDGRYYMTGVSYVGSALNVGKLVDRGYPDYDFPYSGAFDHNVMMSNYLTFLGSNCNRVESIEGFKVGASDQFVLNNDASAYGTFGISNIYCNGQIGNENLVPSSATQSDLLSAENQWSAVINVQYGNFDYHTGGDINGSGMGLDIECRVGLAIGETDVVCCNHHACDDSMGIDFLLLTSPQVCVIPAWETGQPGSDALSRMTASSNRKVYAAAPAANGDGITGSGHVVIRVYDSGSKFRVFVLDDESTEYEITYTSDEFASVN